MVPSAGRPYFLLSLEITSTLVVDLKDDLMLRVCGTVHMNLVESITSC